MRTLSARDAQALDAALHRAALFGRDDLLPVVVRGRDRKKFLHAMLTQEVKDLPDRAVRPAALCDAQGAITALIELVVEPERITLWTHRNQAQTLHDALDKYVIADDVELQIDEDLALVTVVGPDAPGLAAQVGLVAPEAGLSAQVDVAGAPGLCWQGITGGRPGAPHGEGVPELSLQLRRPDLEAVVPVLVARGIAVGCHAAQEALRVLAGRPLLGVDVDAGSLPLEVGSKDAVNYRKGCYLGQEAIAMMTYRGQLRRHLCWVEPTGEARPDAGWTLRTPDGKRAGRMGSLVVWPEGQRALGLALVQRKVYSAGAALVAAGEDGSEAPVRVLATTVPQALEAPTDSAGSAGTVGSAGNGGQA